jgi:IS5 family transposase
MTDDCMRWTPRCASTRSRNWLGYSDPGMEEARYEVMPLRRFAGLSLGLDSLPDEPAIFTFGGTDP